MKKFEKTKHEHLKSLLKLNKQIEMNEKKLKKDVKKDNVPPHYTNKNFYTKLVSIQKIETYFSYSTFEHFV